MPRLPVRLAVCAAAFLFSQGSAPATGEFSPDRWLENGGIASDMSPEFYWAAEVRQMARQFAPTERRVAVPAPPQAAETPPTDASKTAMARSAGTRFTEQADTRDFDEAVRSGRIQPPDPVKARTAHEAARLIVSTAGEAHTATLPDEFPSEFSDYHRGALAFRRGAAQFSEARSIWEALLGRPPEERHHRSTWAAFMLGKIALAEQNPEAVHWFRLTRKLAAAGFADSLGLAADSYGWEARSELRQGHDEAAARLYLAQLALGDDSAIVSL